MKLISIFVSILFRGKISSSFFDRNSIFFYATKYMNAANADTKMRTTVAVVVINETSERIITVTTNIFA